MFGALRRGHGERGGEHIGRAGDVEGVDLEGRVAQLLPHAGLATEREHSVVLVEQRSFLGDQVQPVAHRVDEQHVVALQRGYRSGEVVARIEKHRLPSGRRPGGVDLLGERLHLLAVGQVLGQTLA